MASVDSVAYSSGCAASATPTALASSAVMVTPLGLICAYSASSASVSMDMAMRDTGTCGDVRT